MSEDYYTKDEVDNMFRNKEYVNAALNLKNEVLFSGNTMQTIKTIEGHDILGQGNIMLDYPVKWDDIQNKPNFDYITYNEMVNYVHDQINKYLKKEG